MRTVRDLFLAPGLAAIALIGAVIAPDSHAAVGRTYKCYNEKGELFYLDRFDANRCKGGGAKLNERGRPVETIDRQLTPEERAEADAKAIQDAEAARQKAKQDKADSILMSSYPTEDDLARAHDTEVRLVDTDIKAKLLVLKSQERNLTDLLASAADSERLGQKVSDGVSKNISIMRRQVERQRAAIAAQQKRRSEMDSHYEAQLARFRELKEQEASGQRPGGQ